MATTDLSILCNSLTAQIAAHNLVMNADNLQTASGLTVPTGLDQLLQSSLVPDTNGSTFALPLSGAMQAILSNGNQTLTLSGGTANVLNLEAVPVNVVFTISNSVLQFTMQFTLSSAWTFSQSFPTIGSAVENLLGFNQSYFIFSTQIENAFTIDTSGDQMNLAEGLNFAAPCNLSTLPLLSEFFTLAGINSFNTTVLFWGSVQPPDETNIRGCFPSMDINATLTGLGTLNFFNFLVLDAPYISIEANAYGTPTVFLNLQILIATSETTTISASSNGTTLGQAPVNINVTSATEFPAEGLIGISISGDTQYVNYTSTSSTAFDGCTGGTGTLNTGDSVTGYLSLDVKAAIMLHSQILRVSLSSADLSLTELWNIVPGGSDAWNLLPSFITNCFEDLNINFYSFYTDFFIGSNSGISSVQANFGSSNSLNLFGIFQLDSILASCTCLNPTSSSPQLLYSFSTQFEFPFISGLVFNVTINQDETIYGSCAGTLSLSELINYFNGQSNNNNISIPFDVSLSDFQLYIDVANKQYNFGATANESLQIMGQEILGMQNAQFTIAVSQTTQGGNPVNQYDVNVTGILNLFGIDFDVTAQIATGSNPQTTISINMLNRTLGELLDMLVKFISRDSKAILPFPWSKLNDIQMDALTLEISITDTQHQVTVTYSNAISLGFIDISAFTLSYTKNLASGTTPATASTKISLDCTFFGQTYSAANNNALAWDPVNGNPPPVPNQGSVLDIRYLGIGQHISFTSGTNTSSMESILMALENIAAPPPRQLIPGSSSGQTPSANPLSNLPALIYDGSSSWFIGADLTVAGVVSLGLIFNDPELYGLIVRLSGTKAKSLAGLQFEILYRKINDTIGEYYTELKLPAAMRHLEMGEVSITLPTIAVAIYTNGNFQVDFGFPWNNDFSRSFGLQVFPFVGAGGFYFGVLDGATSSQAPTITNGAFDPVIVFGFGLQAGVGKSINEGVLSATAEITVAGILQGVFGFFQPSDHSQQPATYFKLQGVVAISGVVSGSVNFAIIQANVMIMVYADCHITYECYQPIQLGLDVGVEVDVSLHVLFINIHFSFSTTLSENFTIGSASTPPWTLASSQGNGNGGQHFLSMQKIAQVANGNVPAININWLKTGNAYFTNPPQLPLQFAVLPLVISPSSTLPNTVSFNAMLFIDNGINSSSTSSFDVMMQAVLAWVLKNSSGAGLSALTESTSSTTFISYQQLDDLMKAVVAQGAPRYSDITSFMIKNFSSIEISARTSSSNDSSHTVFAMIPWLKLVYGTTTIDFSTQNLVDDNYVNDIAKYLQSLNITPPTSNRVTFSGKESIPTMVFCDYFMLAIKAALQTAKSILSLYSYTIKNTSTVSTELTTLGIDCSAATTSSFKNFVQANQAISLASGLTVPIGAMDFTVTGTGAQSLNSIVQTLIGGTPTSQNIIDLLQNNLYVEQSVLKGTTLTIPTLTYTVPDNSTNAINQLFGFPANYKPAILETPIPGAAEGYYSPYTKLLFQGGSFTTTSSINTLALVAYINGTTPALIRGKNIQSMMNVGDNDTINVGTRLSLPDFTFVVKPDSQYYIAAYFGVPQTSVVGTISAGQQVTISNIAISMNQPMNLAQLGNYLCASDMGTLQVLLAGQSIITPGITLTTASSYNYTSSTNDTPASIAQRFTIDIAELIFYNLAVFYPKGTSVQIPEATVTVAELMQAMSAPSTTGQGFNNVAGQLSRFLLHGLNLPNPGETIINTDGTINTSANTSPLYTLLGQQFAPGTAQSVELYVIQQDPIKLIIITTEVPISLNSGALGALVSELQSTNVQLPTPQISEYTLYQSSPQRYTLQHLIDWSVPDLPTFMGTPTSGGISNPIICLFPENLKRVLSEQTTPLSLSLLTGSRDISKTQSMVTNPVASYRWATMLTIQVKQIRSNVSASGSLSYIYEVEGMKTEAERHLLTSLIQAYKTDLSNNPDVRFLFDGTDGGLMSDHLATAPDGSDLVRIVKSNLATLIITPEVELYSLLSDLNLTPTETSSPSGQSGISISTSSFSSSGGDSRKSWVINFPKITSSNYAGYNWQNTTGTSFTLPVTSQYASGISFYACGQQGGEIVSFGITVPPAQAEGQPTSCTQNITLTNEWVRYELSFAELRVNQANPTWWEDITTPFSCSISTAQNNSNTITFAIDQNYDIQFYSPPIIEAGISDGLNFLELLWEGSLLRNGGYFLQYQNAQGKGLPDYLFSQGPKADVRLLVLCPTDTEGVSAYHNTVVLPSPIDLSQNVLFAKSDNDVDYHSVLQPGNLGLNLTIPKPPAYNPDSNPAVYLVQSMYNMMSVQVIGNTDFNQSIVSMPAGPQIDSDDDSQWKYHLVLPIANFATSTPNTTPNGYPDPTKSPYNAVGKSLSLNFNSQDIFGNQFSQTISSPPQPLYYDRIIPVNHWPGVAASYDFGVDTSGNPQLNAYLHFDVSRYLPVGEKTLQDCINRASKDQGQIQNIYYQLTGPQVSLNLSTSMVSANMALTPAQIQEITDLVGTMYKCAATMQQLQAVNVTPSGTNTTLAAIAENYSVSLEDLANANKSLPSIFGTSAQINKPTYYTVKYNDTIESICNAASPAITSATWINLIADETTILKPGTVIDLNTTDQNLYAYTIQPGDSLNSIVQKYSSVIPNLTLQSLRENNLTVPNIFNDSIQLFLSSSIEALPVGNNASLEGIAQAWGITVLQLASNNSTAPLNSAAPLSIPDTYTLSVEDTSTYSVYVVPPIISRIFPSPNSLRAISENQSVNVADLFAINQGLANVVMDMVSIEITIGFTPITYTLKATDTLLSVYNYFLNNGAAGLSQEQFISLIELLPIFKVGAVILLPPPTVTISNSITPSYAANTNIFEIQASIEISRDTSLIDSNVPAEVPQVTSVTSALTAHTTMNTNGNVSLTSWAQTFESAFPGIKVAVHRDSSSAGSTDGHLWAVMVEEEANSANSNVIGYTIGSDSAMYYAPAPLANQFVSRNQVPIQTYRSGIGFTQQTSAVNFSKIDMDQWAQQFLSALNIMCSPDFAVPASDLNLAAFTQIMEAKQQIAASISSSIISILENDNGSVADRIEAASETLEERLLQDITSAYTVESIVQLDVNIQNSTYTTLNAPALIGKPLANIYTINSRTDTLTSIAASAFTQPVAVRYLAEQIQDIPGVIASAALNKNSFTAIAGTTQDSANIFDQLIVNGIIESNGIIVSSFSPQTLLHLNLVYAPISARIKELLLTSQTEQQRLVLINGKKTKNPTPTDNVIKLSVNHYF